MKRALALLGLASVALIAPLTPAVGAPVNSRGASVHAHPGALRQLAAAARATAKFHTLSVAEEAGYGLFTDAAGIACIDHQPEGAMGIHYVRGDIVGDGTVSTRTPEALVYEQRHGTMRLVALEYVVFAADWDAKHAHPPKLFGKEFMLTLAGNRYGLPDYYSLHVWIWKRNPSGMFEMWNPNVHCGCGAASG